MCAANLPVARPLAIIEERTFGVPGRAALLMEAASGNDLLSIVNNNTRSDDELKTIASKLKNSFDRMRDLKITHGDMKATNILVNENLDLKLIDIDAAKQHCSPSSFHKAREKDRLRFLANWTNKPLALAIFRSVYS
jgi:serine/threonine protein kinase